jgi:transposase
VAANCSNTNKEGVSLHKFPTDETRKKLWKKQVQRPRANCSGHSTTSVICSEHFTDGSFDESSGLQMAKGFTKRRKLKPDAVPTIFKSHENPMPPLKPREAFLKRKRQEVFFVIKFIYF